MAKETNKKAKEIAEWLVKENNLIRTNFDNGGGHFNDKFDLIDLLDDKCPDMETYNQVMEMVGLSSHGFLTTRMLSLKY